MNLCSFVFFNPFLPVVIAPQCVLVHFKANIAISLKRKTLENKAVIVIPNSGMAKWDLRHGISFDSNFGNG